MDPVVKSIGRLQKRFPITFPKNPAPKLPLKIGIFQDLVAHSKELSLSEAELRDAIKTWCRGSRYWKCLVEGAARVDLSGVEAGKVTAQEAAGAQRLQAHRAGKGAPKAAGAPAAEAPVAVPAAEAPGAAQGAQAPVAAASAEALLAAPVAEAPAAAGAADAPVAATSAEAPVAAASAETPTTAATPVPEAEEADADSTAPGESATMRQASPTEPSADNAAVVQPPAAPITPAAPSA